jgi:hypothetical protein
MGYIYNLIERATDTGLDLENNQIGNYRITPQHGNVAVYHIYKDQAKNRWSKRKWDNQHVCTITIDFNSVVAEVDSDHLSRNEISQIMDVLHNVYDNFDVTIENM